MIRPLVDPLESRVLLASVAASLRITEINYNPKGNGDEEFVELKNIGAATVNLAGVHFTVGITVTLNGVNLLPGESCVVVKDQATFESRYTTTNMKIVGQFGPAASLSNGGEQLTLVDGGSTVIQDFAYDDNWYPDTDGNGQTLVINDPTQPLSAWNNASAWHASLHEGGSPGADENPTSDGAIVVSEVLAHTDASVTGDWVEFHNTSNQSVTLTNWFLSDDDSDPEKYRIPATTVAPGGYVVFNQFTQFDVAGGPGVITPFAFSEFGETVVLSSANGFGVLSGYQVSQSFEASQREISIGRIPTSQGYDFGFLNHSTKGTANAGPLIGPVVINEILYNPVAPTPEYLELRNISADFTPLYDPAFPTHVWKFTNGITYDFPQGIVLSPGEHILMAATDPATFRAAHPEVPASVRIFGPFVGSLNNGGETITVAQPADPELDGSYVYYTVDSVKYDPAAPWPVVDGVPIAKPDSNAYTNDPVNWAPEISALGSPGRVNYSVLGGDSTPHAWTLKLSAGNFQIYDTVPASGSPIYSAPLSSVPAFSVFGSSGSDTLCIDTSAGIPLPAAGFEVSGISNLIVKLAGSSNSISVAPSGTGIQVGGTTGLATLNPFKVTGLTKLTLNAPDGSNSLSVSGGAFALDTTGHFSLAASASSNITLAATQRLAGLSLSNSAKLDLADHDLIVDYSSASPLATIRQWVFTGQQGGSIAQLRTSYTPADGHPAALAPFDNKLLHLATWDGQPLASGANFSQVVIKRTYAGDTSLDGQVDSADYANVLANMGRTGTTWLFGDVNNDGNVTVADYAVVTANLGAGTGAAAPLLLVAQETPLAAEAVPSEPAAPLSEPVLLPADPVPAPQPVTPSAADAPVAANRSTTEAAGDKRIASRRRLRWVLRYRQAHRQRGGVASGCGLCFR